MLKIDLDDLSRYSKLYDLKKIRYDEKVSEEFFEYCKTDRRFVVVTVCNRKGEVLFIRDFNRNVGWELPGGFVNEDFSVIETINRIVRREVGTEIDVVEPITIIENCFMNGVDKYTHKGLGFVAITESEKIEDEEGLRRCFSKSIPKNMAYQDREILKNSRNFIKEKSDTIPINEIESSKETSFRRKLHSKFLNKYFGYKASEKQRKEIIKKIDFSPNTVLDAACGKDKTLFKIKEIFEPEICVANDVSWEKISRLKELKKEENVVFTNHDIKNFPFKQKFDLILFKNSLHHIEKEKQEKVLKKLSEKCKVLLVVDVKNPKKSSLKSKVWNWYYRNILDDQGEDFLDFSEFKEVLKSLKGSKEFDCFETVKGQYMIGKVNK